MAKKTEKQDQKCADILGLLSEFNKGRFLIDAGKMTTATAIGNECDLKVFLGVK